MALNVALPLSGFMPELLSERYALLSPLPRDFDENLELLVTPYESSESGIGSSNENENKNPKSSSDDDDELTTSSASSTSSSTSSPTPRIKSDPSTAQAEQDEAAKVNNNETNLNVKVQYQNRDVLDLAKNLTDSTWKFQYARLPDNNIATFMANRSQYHRLGANGLLREYDLHPCNKCTFEYPVNKPHLSYDDDSNNGATDNDNNGNGSVTAVAAATATATTTKPITRSNDKAQNNLPSFQMYKHF